MTSKLTCDVVVIGSGAGGSAVAGELIRAGRSVIIVEAGPIRFGKPGLHARNLDPSEAGIQKWGEIVAKQWAFPCFSSAPVEGLPGMCVSHGVGGMFSLWCSNAPRPDTSELPDWFPAEEWTPYLTRAEKLMKIDRDVYRGGVRAARILDAARKVVSGLPSGREVQPMPIAAQRVGDTVKYTSADDLLETKDESRLKIISDHVARRIIFNGHKATAVSIVPRGGGEETVISADTIVIAAGTVASAQLAAASNIDAGPALGANLLDHPCISARVVLRKEILEGVPKSDPVFSIWIPHSKSHPWQNEIFRFPAPPPAGTRDEDGADVTGFVAMDVNPENRMTFSRTETDGFGLPKVSVRLQHSEADHERISQAVAENYALSAAIGNMGRGWSTFIYQPGGSAHLMGALRMGPKDDGTSVVDKFGKFWRYDNLYAAGNGVLGTSNGGNPTFTMVAAALRTSDRILGLAN